MAKVARPATAQSHRNLAIVATIVVEAGWTTALLRNMDDDFHQRTSGQGWKNAEHWRRGAIVEYFHLLGATVTFPDLRGLAGLGKKSRLTDRAAETCIPRNGDATRKSDITLP